MEKFDQAAYVAEYKRQNIRQFRLTMNRITESELIYHLERQENIQGYLKNLIRKDMRK